MKVKQAKSVILLFLKINKSICISLKKSRSELSNGMVVDRCSKTIKLRSSSVLLLPASGIRVPETEDNFPVYHELFCWSLNSRIGQCNIFFYDGSATRRSEVLIFA